MNIKFNEVNIDAFRSLARTPGNQDDYLISQLWTENVIAVLATATQGTVLSFSSVEAFDEEVAKAIRSELQTLAWMSLASFAEVGLRAVEAVRIDYVMAKLAQPSVHKQQFRDEHRKGVMPTQHGSELCECATRLLSSVEKNYPLYPLLLKATVEMIQYQNFYTVYPVLREQLRSLLSLRVAFLRKQGL